MITSLEALPQSPCAYPDLTELNPKRKDKKYCIQFGRALLTNYNQAGTEFFKKRAYYAELERYANGDIDVRSVLKPKGGQNQQAQQFKPLAIMHKPLMSVEGLLKDHSYEATVTPVDAVSREERADYEAKMKAWMEHQSFLKEIGLQQPGGPGADIPIDDDDLQLHMEVSYKIREAIEYEQKIAYAFDRADFARQDQLCIRDDSVLGLSVIHMRRNGARRLPVHLSPSDCFILNSKSENFPNLQAGAHLERLPLGQVMAEIKADPDTNLDASQLQALKNVAAQSQNNMGTGMNYGGSYFLDAGLGEPEMAGQVTVVRFGFMSTDLEQQKELKDSNGNRQLFDLKPGYKGAADTSPTKAEDVKIHKRTVQTWYEGTLILGTDIGYGCGRAYEQLPDEDDPFTCLPLYIVNAPGMIGGKVKSMVELCKTPLDMAARAAIKLQHIEAKWGDLTVKFNANALLEAAVEGGVGGKVLSRSEIMDFFLRENIVVGNAFDDAGNPLGPVAEFMETPLANTITRHWQTIQNAKNEIADITGINGAISGDDPASRQGKGVTDLAILGSQNALNHLFVAKRNRFERAAKAIAANIKDTERADRKGGAVPVVGNMAVRTRSGTKGVYLQPNPKIAERTWLVKITQEATAEKWARFENMLNNAVTEGKITAGDVAFIEVVDNLKQARYLLWAREKRNQMVQSQQAQQASEMQAQAASQAATAAGEAADKTATLAHGFAMELADKKGKWDYDTALAAHGMKMEQADQAAGHKLDSQDLAQQHAAEQAEGDRMLQLSQQENEIASQQFGDEANRQHALELQANEPQPVGA